MSFFFLIFVACFFLEISFDFGFQRRLKFRLSVILLCCLNILTELKNTIFGHKFVRASSGVALAPKQKWHRSFRFRTSFAVCRVVSSGQTTPLCVWLLLLWVSAVYMCFSIARSGARSRYRPPQTIARRYSASTGWRCERAAARHCCI
jgi:hypothetical protein